MEWAHRKFVAVSLVGSELPTKVVEGIERVLVVKAFLVFAVAAFHLAIVTRRIRPDKLVADPQLLQCRFKKSWLVPGCRKPVGKLQTIIGLNALYRNSLPGKFQNNLLEKICGRIGALLWISAQNAVAGKLVNSSVLIQPQFWVCDTLSGYYLHVDLDSLAGMRHLFIRLGCILLCLLALGDHSVTLHDPVQTFHTPVVTSFSESAP